MSGRFGERNDEITVAVDEVLGALVHSGTHGSPRAFEWTVFTFDAVRGALLPTYPAPRDADIAVLTFKSGNGACGRAFRDGGIVVALGDAASNGEYGLTIEQQARFAKYRSVAAARINWEGRPIGSLTAIAAQEDRYFEGAAGRAILFRLAETVGAVLVAMLGVGTTTQ